MFCFADEGTQDSTTLNVTATKSGSLSSEFALVVTASVPQSIVQEGQSLIGEIGSVESFDLTPVLKQGLNLQGLNDALTLTVSTNSKKPVSIDVWFSAFRDTTRYKGEGEEMEFDGVAASYITATWTARSNENKPEYTATDQAYGSVDYSYKLNVVANNTTTLTNNKSISTKAENASGNTLSLVFTPVAQNASIPASDAPTLPGMDTSDPNNLTLVSRTVIFNMSMGKKFDEFPANTNYTCTVRITVKGD